jgi:uncharacterized protein YqhQ
VDQNDLAMGGQAVIEGVMMKSPSLIVTSVRKTSGEIVSRVVPFRSVTKRYKVLGVPVLRGGVLLVEQLYHGIRALTYSADVASAVDGEIKEDKSWKSSLITVATLVLALGLGLLLFFYLPLVVAGKTGVKDSIAFNVIDGLVRLAVFFAYLALLNLWKEMRRVFEYHGAEHKSIHAYEHGEALEVENVTKYTTRHPRCGTSFLLIVMVVSIVVFIFMGRPDTIGERVLRLVVVPLIGGISYEITRLAGKHRTGLAMKIITAPGLALQRFTTREPSAEQIEVALEALKYAVGAKTEVGNAGSA